MSHIVTIKTEVRDAAAVSAACQRLGLPTPIHGTTKLFSSQATGLAVQLPGWQYPVVCDLHSGQLQYDNYNGSWGEQRRLDAFLQSYAIERAKIECRRKGHTVSEQQLTDGSVKLTIQVWGRHVKQITLIVTPDGQSRIETQGFQGAECQQASEFLRCALGVAGQEQLKPEYFRQANQENITTETR